MVSTATISQYLEGLDFPATKQEMIDYAEDRNAPPDVLDTLSNLPEPSGGKFYSMADVWDAVGEIE
ncbi:MAG: DUF2795 domain-containing protein [Armatimonadota bacterium]